MEAAVLVVRVLVGRIAARCGRAQGRSPHGAGGKHCGLSAAYRRQSSGRSPWRCRTSSCLLGAYLVAGLFTRTVAAFAGVAVRLLCRGDRLGSRAPHSRQLRMLRPQRRRGCRLAARCLRSDACGARAVSSHSAHRARLRSIESCAAHDANAGSSSERSSSFALIVVGAVLFYFLGPGHRRVQSASVSPIVGKAQVGQPAPKFEVATTARSLRSQQDR